jgi:hypothetical protein
MNSYKFTLTITNSNTFIIKAYNYEEAKKIAFDNGFADRNAVKDLCVPTEVHSELTCSVKAKHPKGFLRVWTYFNASEETEVDEFTSEWSTLLGTEVTYDLDLSNREEDSWYCETFVTQEQIDEFNMSEDWFTIQ